jgi:hypothetical protein
MTACRYAIVALCEVSLCVMMVCACTHVRMCACVYVDGSSVVYHIIFYYDASHCEGLRRHTPSAHTHLSK